ncbi:sacsin N-terminal ATP-binding-like domain-containing protein [Halopiger thermotolerans]
MALTSREWADELTERYADLLEKLESIGPNSRYDTPKKALFNETSIGGGEAGTAGAHQDRELVELLQNGRDAIQKADETGTLYVAVSREGVLVANTGAPFEFDDEEVLEDLRKVSRSGKETDAIGEKGVGLTSVCTIGDAYEVWTDLNDGNLARLQCGPVNPTAAVLSRSTATDNNPEVKYRLDRFRERLATSDLTNLVTTTDQENRITLDSLRAEDVTSLPFFSYPLPLEIPDDRAALDGSLQQVARQLLTDASVIVDGPEIPDQFTTAVIVRFKDDDLTAFRSALGVEQERDRDPDRIANNLWARLRYSAAANAYGESRGEVTPESLIHFGNIDQLVLDQLEGTERTAHERWDIDRSEPATYATDTKRPVESTSVTVTVNQQEQDHDQSQEQVQQTYELFHWVEGHEPIVPDTLLTTEQRRSTDDEQEVDVRPRILVPTDNESPAWLANQNLQAVLEGEALDGIGPESHAYPPYLYYPITGASKRFPFCLHANVEVSKDREKLYSDSDQYNAYILDHCATLIGDVATVLARQEGGTKNQGSVTSPWNLLPPTPAGANGVTLADIINDEVHLDETGVGLLDLFSRAVYEQLGKRSCLPTEGIGDDDSPATAVNEALLHPDPEVVGAFAALYLVREKLNEPAQARNPAKTTRRLPTLTSLLTFLRWSVHDDLDTVDWSKRYRYLLEEAPPSTNDDAERHHSLVEAWTTQLSEHLATPDARIVVSAPIGRQLFLGSVRLVDAYAEFKDKDVQKVLNEEFDIEKAGVHILPCSYRSKTTKEERVQLVPVESHGEGGNVTETYTRTVFWRGDDAPETELRIPPDSIGLSVFVIDEAISDDSRSSNILSEAGNDWGIVQLRSYPQYVRELLGSTQRQQRRTGEPDSSSKELSDDALSFFAGAVANQERERLIPTEGAYLNHDNVQKHTHNSERRRNLLNRLAVRRNRLGADLLDQTDGTAHRIADIRLPPKWQALRNTEERIDTWEKLAPDINEQPTTSVEPVRAGPIVRPPNDDRWQFLAEQGISPTTAAKLLGILGLSAFPEVEALTQTETPKGGRDHWNPLKWNVRDARAEINAESISSLRTTLQQVVDRTAVGSRGEDSGSYLDLITAPEFGPQMTAGHSDHCSVKDLRGRYTDSELGSEPSAVEGGLDSYDVALEAWAWMPTKGADDPFARLGVEYVCDLLATYGDRFEQSILTTGWSCRADHGGRHGWTETVPTLLNWQLRAAPIWSKHNAVQTPDWWSDGSILWAVERAGEGSQTGSWLPTVDVGSTEVDVSIWRQLGVRPLEELSATEAALRLQKIQEELAAAPLVSEMDEPVALDQLATDGIADGWKTVYSRLITPIADYLDRDDSTLGELPFLTHFPVKAGDRWASVPIELIRDRESYWFSDSQQLPWEDRDGSWEGPWVVETPTVGRGAALATALDCKFRTQAGDRPQLSAAQLDASANPEMDERLAAKLRGRRPLILAALSAETSETFQPDHREDLEVAIDHIRGVPEEVFVRYRERFSLQDSRFGERSAVYPLGENGAQAGSSRYGLAYNVTSVDENDPNPTVFTEALQVLFERSRSTYLRLALADEEEVLAADLDVSAVRRAIGQGSVDALRSDIEAATTLLDKVGVSVDTDQVLSRLDDRLAEADTDAYTVRTNIRQAIRDGTPDTNAVKPFIDSTQSASEPVVEMVQTLLSDRAALADECPCTTLSQTIAPETFVTWADAHHPTFQEHHSLPKEQAQRLEKVCRIWWNADEETRWTDLQDIQEWRVETRQQPAEWSWTSPPFAHRLLESEDKTGEENCWLSLGPAAVDNLCETILTVICNDGAPDSGSEEESRDSKEALRRSLRQYLETGTFPDTHDMSTSEETHTRRVRERAFETIQAEPIRFDDNASAGVSGRIQSRDAGYGSGGSSELTDRPEFAEEVIFASVCSQLQTWAKETDDWQQRLGEHLQPIVNESSPCPWHNPGRCSDLNRLEQTPRRLAKRLLDSIEAGQTTRSDDPPRLAFVAADERGPGYDILDITGRVAGTAGDKAAQPTPIEVKAVTGDAPYTVRFTVNEFRRALEFVRNDVPYRIQLVRVEGGDIDALDSMSVMPAPGVTFWTPTDLYAYLPTLDLPAVEDVPDDVVDTIVATTLERTIRGGYLRITFG